MPAIGIIYTFLYCFCSKINKSYAIMKVDIIITYVYMLMSCPIDAPAESGGVIMLWSIVWDCYACINYIRMYIQGL